MGVLARAAGVLMLVTAGELLPVGAAVTGLTRGLTAQADPVASTMSQQEDRRLANGQFIRAGNRSGEGQLAISNNGSHDAVVTLARNRNAVYSVYVRQGMQFTVTGIRDGTYETFFTSGMDWDSRARAFTRDRTFQRFDNSLQFTTTSAQSTIWKITLYEVPGGNANVSNVNAADYPTP